MMMVEVKVFRSRAQFVGTTSHPNFDHDRKIFTLHEYMPDDNDLT